MTDDFEGPGSNVILGEPEPESAPPTSTQREWLRQAVHDVLVEQMAPLLSTWDARSSDMLEVLAEAGSARLQVRSAARSIKVAGWLGVLALVAGLASIWIVLEHERDDRRKFRDAEAIRRLEAAQMIIKAGHEDVTRIDELVQGQWCPKVPRRK